LENFEEFFFSSVKNSTNFANFMEMVFLKIMIYNVWQKFPTNFQLEKYNLSVLYEVPFSF